VSQRRTRTNRLCDDDTNDTYSQPHYFTRRYHLHFLPLESLRLRLAARVLRRQRLLAPSQRLLELSRERLRLPHFSPVPRLHPPERLVRAPFARIHHRSPRRHRPSVPPRSRRLHRRLSKHPSRRRRVRRRRRARLRPRRALHRRLFYARVLLRRTRARSFLRPSPPSHPSNRRVDRPARLLDRPTECTHACVKNWPRQRATRRARPRTRPSVRRLRETEAVGDARQRTRHRDVAHASSTETTRARDERW